MTIFAGGALGPWRVLSIEALRGESAPEDAPRFDELLAMLRATEEWTYVDREVDIRLTSV